MVRSISTTVRLLHLYCNPFESMHRRTMLHWSMIQFARFDLSWYTVCFRNVTSHLITTLARLTGKHQVSRRCSYRVSLNSSVDVSSMYTQSFWITCCICYGIYHQITHIIRVRGMKPIYLKDWSKSMAYPQKPAAIYQFYVLALVPIAAYN